MKKIPEKTILNLVDFFKSIDVIRQGIQKSGNNADLLFRGQNVDKPLLPKIARLKLRSPNLPLKQTEKLIMSEFKREYMQYADMQPQNEWDVMALAQHHALPTRLLDWTTNPLIALWFAVGECPIEYKNPNNNGVFWILGADKSDYLNLDDTEAKGPYSNSKTMIFRPKAVARRISAQSGLFTAHKINKDGKMLALDHNVAYKAKLTKFLIPYNEMKFLRKSLIDIGINPTSIYPDLDGLCKKLQSRFAKYDDESPISV